MTPTPNFRPYTIYTEKRIWWALERISEGIRGDGPSRPETTRDGVATTLLADAIEARCPGLLDGFRERQALDSKWTAKVSDSLHVKETT